jgi:hypothetical protein
LLDVPNLSAAKRRLAAREGIDSSRIESDIGDWDCDGDTKGDLEDGTIAAWASGLGLTGVVWTNLSCGIKKASRDVMPSSEEVIAFLRSLDATKQPAAEAYVRQAPAQIDTPYRRMIERELGWFRRT